MYAKAVGGGCVCGLVKEAELGFVRERERNGRVRGKKKEKGWIPFPSGRKMARHGSAGEKGKKKVIVHRLIRSEGRGEKDPSGEKKKGEKDRSGTTA